MPRPKKSVTARRSSRLRHSIVSQVWNYGYILEILVAEKSQIALGPSTHRYSDRRKSPSYDKDYLDTFIQTNRARKAKQRQSRRSPTIPESQATESVRPEDSLSNRLSGSSSTSELSYGGMPMILRDPHPQEVHYRKIGYFPFLDEEVLDLLEIVLETPNLARDMLASHKSFEMGLKRRNVNMKATENQDPYVNEIRKSESQLPAKNKESPSDEALQQEVWKLDKVKCGNDNEALFQRTLMMSMIDRHRFFFNKATTLQDRCDYSVEKLWDCPPMPTTAISTGDPLLPRPKPDLCVSFRLDEVVPSDLLIHMPAATGALIVFEGGPMERAFPFFTIEAKKAFTSPDDPAALNQSLNNASQALHNMYEFFKEAGDEATFFNKVRFFSAAAMSKGVNVRIHRAVETSERIVPTYALRFEYEEFMRIDESDFQRKKVVDVFENIIWSYGPKLFSLLHEAAKAVAEKFKNNSNLARERDEVYYRHGQIGGRFSASVAPSHASKSIVHGGDQLAPSSKKKKLDIDNRASTSRGRGRGRGKRRGRQ